MSQSTEIVLVAELAKFEVTLGSRSLAVALGTDDADRRLVDQVRVGPDRACQPDRLGGAAGVAIDENVFRFHWADSVGWLAHRFLGERTRPDQPAPGNAATRGNIMDK